MATRANSSRTSSSTTHSSYAAIIGGTVTQAEDLLRNRSGLESALARPETYAHYEEADLALQAAVLTHGIAESQCFIDGNKRLALVVMLTFLELNSCVVEATDPELADWIISLSAGTTPDQLAPCENACGSWADAGRPVVSSIET